MFKIKLKDPSAGSSEKKNDTKAKRPLPKIKIAKPQPPPSSSSSTSTTSSEPSTKVKIKAPSSSSGSSSKPKSKNKKHIKLKLKPGSSQPVVKKVPRIRVKPTRIPGEGYDSEASDIEDDPLVEEAIILRLLPDAELDYVRHCVETGDYSNFHIKWKDRLRAIIYINSSMYAAQLMNLPNIVEAYKSVDKKNIFKTVDICQILLVVKKIQDEEEIESLNVSPNDVISDGLTPPLNNISKSKYRRQMNNDYIEKIEARVDELLRLDEEAEESQFELIDPESLNIQSETPISTTAVSTPSEVTTSKATMDTFPSATTVGDEGAEVSRKPPSKEHDDDLELELEQVLGEDFSLHDGETIQVQGQNGQQFQVKQREDGEGNELEVEEQDGEEMEEMEEEDEEEEEESDESDDDDDDDDDDDNSDNEQGASRKVEVDEDEQHNALLRDGIKELLATIDQNKSRLEKTSNPLLRSRFIDSISKLEKELENKKRQLKTSEDKTQNKKDKSEQQGGEQTNDEDEDQEMEDASRGGSAGIGRNGDGGRDEDEDEEEEEEEDEGDNDDDDDDLDELFG